MRGVMFVHPMQSTSRRSDDSGGVPASVELQYSWRAREEEEETKHASLYLYLFVPEGVR
jgi:hypothetical protein